MGFYYLIKLSRFWGPPQLWFVYFYFGSDQVRIWDSPEKGREIHAEERLLVDELPDSVWLEAVVEGVTEYNFTFINSSVYGQPILFDPIPGSGVQYDVNRLKTRGGLTAFRPMSNGPNTGYDLFGKIAVPEADEEDEDRGAGIRLNFDDDNGNSTPDASDVNGAVANEDDLIEVHITRVAGEFVRLERSSIDLRLWTTKEKGFEISFPGGGLEAGALPWNGDELKVYAEWASPDPGDAELKLIDAADGVVQDTLKFHVFEGIALGFTGRLGGYADLKISRLIDFARLLYASGFDSYFYHERDVPNGPTDLHPDPPSGPPWSEVLKALTVRSVHHVGIYGHSWGGSATNYLAKGLASFSSNSLLREVFDIPDFDYNLAVTGYVDAITRPFLAAAVTGALTDRPLGSQYHANYYQLVDPHLTGASMGSDAEVDVDVNAHRHWEGEPYGHTTIDDEVELHKEMLSTLDLQMPR